MELHKISFDSYILFVFVFSLFSIVDVAKINASYNGNDYFVIAADLLDRGMYLEALGIYKEIVGYSDNQKNKAQALLLLGKTYSKYLDQQDAALEQFESTIKLYPESISAQEAMFNAGVVFFRKGDVKRAYDIFTYYIERYPQGADCQLAREWAEKLTSEMARKKTKIISPGKPRVAEAVIRVLIKNGVRSISVASEKTITVLDPFAGGTVYRGTGTMIFRSKGQSLVLNGRILETQVCRLESSGTTLMVDGRRYRGTFTLAVVSGKIEVVNHVPMEQYLYGVVPEEMDYKWEPEALMAQAVASRTYALYVKGKSGDKPYDVEATTFSQVYGGYDAETEPSNSAVDATRGQIITFDGNPIIAYFHSNSGGHTEDAKNVWNVDVPYLRGIYDRFSEDIPGGTWEYYLSYDAMRKQLNNDGLDIKRIRGLEANGSSPSGRCLQMRIFSDKGMFVFTSNNFRIKVGGTKLKSTLFQTRRLKRGVLFKGTGYGHGVGMSQCGANKMAEAGFSYRQILEYYYRGTQLIALSEL